MVASICHEIELRSEYLNEEVDTIYFGGGTPSLLNKEQLKKILATISRHFHISTVAELTLEANPEDITFKKLASLIDCGINRLSIGIQTFSNDRLKWMNRAHTSEDAISAYLLSRAVGFANISLDLIYAIPSGEWISDLEKITGLEPEHISFYGLTIEDKTVFGKWEKDQKLVEVNEEDAATQYLDAIQYLASNGYHQYEVSNFSKPGFKSKHNSSYWAGISYLGVGPSAHSYDGASRQFNVNNNTRYIEALKNGTPHHQTEQLSPAQLMNESILTQLRTVNGIDTRKFKESFQVDLVQLHWKTISALTRQKLVSVNNQRLALTTNGFLIADDIALKLFF